MLVTLLSLAKKELITIHTTIPLLKEYFLLNIEHVSNYFSHTENFITTLIFV